MDGLDLEFVASHAAPTAELLRFYRSKVSSFEAERMEQLRRLGDAEAQNAELHRLRWEARAREEEIAELQRALSDSRLFLFDEREHALKLAAENDGLKSQEVEDRRKIAHLLSITEPLTHEVCIILLLDKEIKFYLLTYFLNFLPLFLPINSLLSFVILDQARLLQLHHRHPNLQIEVME